jgi:pilus assembly protein CpaE
MSDQIHVLIVDDIAETRDHLAKLLGFDADIDVVGAAASGEEALEMAARLRPDIVLMDINMPGMDGITATEQLSSRVPTAATIMMSVQGEADYLRRSMLAGAREFLVKPFSSDELTASIRQVHAREREKIGRMAAASPAAATSGEPGRIVAVFSPKGGVGRTTIAVNLAIAAAATRGSVVLVDGSFQFGDVGVLLNLNPRTKSIADLVPELEAGGDPESLDTFVVSHSSGLKALLAPPTPEMAELVTAASVRQVLDALRARNDLVIVDCGAAFNEPTLAILDMADTILAVLTLEITSIKNLRLFLEVAEQLGYSRTKVRLVLNRADSALGIRVADVEHSLGRTVDHSIVSDGKSVVLALNRGVPFIVANKDAQVSQDIQRIATSLSGSPAGEVAEQQRPAARRSLLAWR